MSAIIQNIATAVPRFCYTQDFARDRMKQWVADPKAKRLVRAIYNRSGIDTRHSVSGDFQEEAEGTLFGFDEAGTMVSPSTQQRNDVYAENAKTLAVDVARKLLDDSLEYQPQDITHLVFASCTGFCNPGPDLHVIRELGLSETVERYTLGFMGCYAAFPALRMAKQFCEADAKAVVMVICLELCSLHMQIDERVDSLVANSLFADGAAAALVTADGIKSDQELAKDGPVYRLDDFSSALIPSGEADMAWDIGDHGFNIVLSSYVPEVIAGNVVQLMERALANCDCQLSDVSEWALHPGGRAIIDKIAGSLDLPDSATNASREVLRQYGNMSSATILFVLKTMLDNKPAGDGKTLAIAFGPGLTVETSVMQRIESVVGDEDCRTPDRQALPAIAGLA
jgi:predicted naringenin-chalcone synthase